MSLWNNTDTSASAPVHTVDVVTGNTGTQAYGVQSTANTGLFGISVNETAGTGNVGTITVVNAGTGFTARPTITITGANTTQATATAVGTVVSATITAAGTGYAVGNTFTATAGSGTAAILTITTVNASGNVTGVSITTPGAYTALPTLTNNPFTSNTGSGTGFTATLAIGVGPTITVTAAGEGYSSDTIGLTVGGAGGTASELAIALTGQELVSKGAHAGWVLRNVGTGGRAGRVQLETLVAMGSMTGDGADDAVAAP
jgi:hypothetical protein